jgi:6-phosphogluconolactonase
MELTLINKPEITDIAREAFEFIPRAGRTAISGGSTFQKIFPLWAEMWDLEIKTEFFPVDERIVPVTHVQSNWGMACNLLFYAVNDTVSKDNFAASPEVYADILKRKFQGKFPVFDAIFLGVGRDGHTASLFPGGDYLNDQSSPVLETESPVPPKPRVTLGPGVLSAAKKLIVIVTGTEKKVVLKRVLDGDETLPVVQILKRRKHSVLLVQELPRI